MQRLSATAADLDALLPLLARRGPLRRGDRKSDIETALRIAREYKLKLILAARPRGADRGKIRGGRRAPCWSSRST